MRRQAPLTKSKGTEIGVQKGPKCAKPCKMCTNKKTLFWMPRQAPLPKRTNIGVRRAQKCAKPCKMWANQKRNALLDAQASSTYKTHRNWSAKSTTKYAKPCKMCTNQNKNLFGCPGKLHLQNAQKLECKKPKNVHKKNHLFGWMPRQAPLTKRTELGVRRAQKCAKPCKMCANQKTKTFLDAQASSTYKTHRNWSAKSPKMCTKKITCLDGCPGKLHLQNAQNLECKKHKNMQNHAKLAKKIVDLICWAHEFMHVQCKRSEI